MNSWLDITFVDDALAINPLWDTECLPALFGDLFGDMELLY